MHVEGTLFLFFQSDLMYVCICMYIYLHVLHILMRFWRQVSKLLIYITVCTHVCGGRRHCCSSRVTFYVMYVLYVRMHVGGGAIAVPPE